MNRDIVLCLKINTEKWIKKLLEGSVCFNRAGYFIEKAETTGNNEQGDRFEGIFARLRKSNSRIIKYENLLGEDLEIIDDGLHVLLRRISSRNIPIFCMYGISKDELRIVNEPVLRSDGELHAKSRYDVPEKMYDGFLDIAADTEDAVWGFYVSSGHFYEELDRTLTSQNITFIKKIVTYDVDLTKEFELKIDASYPELFHKRTELAYQHEVRYILPKNPTNEKYVFMCSQLSSHSAGIAPGALYMDMDVICELLPEEGE